MKLNLGCGIKKRKGYFNVDVNPDVKPDMIWDMDKYPYPFDNNTIDKVYMDNVLEHLEDPYKVANEVLRILKPGGVWEFIVPYWNYTHSHRLNHKHLFSEAIVPDLIQAKHDFKLDGEFALKKLELIQCKGGKMRFIPFKNLFRHFFCNMIKEMRVVLIKK